MSPGSIIRRDLLRNGIAPSQRLWWAIGPGPADKDTRLDANHRRTDHKGRGGLQIFQRCGEWGRAGTVMRKRVAEARMTVLSQEGPHGRANWCLGDTVGRSADGSRVGACLEEHERRACSKATWCGVDVVDTPCENI